MTDRREELLENFRCSVKASAPAINAAAASRRLPCGSAAGEGGHVEDAQGGPIKISASILEWEQFQATSLLCPVSHSQAKSSPGKAGPEAMERGHGLVRHSVDVLLGSELFHQEASMSLLAAACSWLLAPTLQEREQPETLAQEECLMRATARCGGIFLGMTPCMVRREGIALFKSECLKKGMEVEEHRLEDVLEKLLGPDWKEKENDRTGESGVEDVWWCESVDQEEYSLIMAWKP